MTIILGLPALADNCIILASDSRAINSGMVITSVPKLFRRGDWILGFAGEYVDVYHYLRRADFSQDLSDPRVQMDIFRKMRQDFVETLDVHQPAGDKPDLVQITGVLAHGVELYNIYADGPMEIGLPYVMRGIAPELARYLISDFGYHQNMTRAEVLKVAEYVITQVATVSAGVALPMQWKDTLGNGDDLWPNV